MGNDLKSLLEQPEKSLLGRFLSRNGRAILALLPFTVLIYVVVTCGVDVPFWDQWEFVPLLERSYEGQLTFHDLWAQHNEHRLLFPKLMMLGLARLTSWDIRCELGVNIVLALGIFAVIAGQIKLTARNLGVVGLRWAIPAISAAVFSISQYQNWLWGWQMQMILNVLAVVGGIVLLANPPFRWWKFIASALLGIVATFSFGDGILFWPIGMLILFVTTRGQKERKAGIAGWIVVSTLTTVLFLYHYENPEGHAPLDLIFKMPLEYAVFVFKYIGGICAQYPSTDNPPYGELAFVFGIGVTAALCWAGGTLLSRKIAGLGALLPFVAMSAYSVGAALLTGVGRVGLGSDQALASRYCTMAMPLWTSLIVMLVLLMKRGGGAAGGDFTPKAPGGILVADDCRSTARWLLMIVVSLLVFGSGFAIHDARAMARGMAFGRERLLFLGANPGAEIDPGLSALYPRPIVIVERNPVLVTNRLSVFRNQRN